jgi:hypothetical protein
MHPQDNNPYDFIMNPSAPPPKKGLPIPGSNSNPFLVKIGLIVGGVIILMIAVTVALNLFTGGKTSTEEFQSLAQTQQEVIRVAEIGDNDARSQSVKNAAKNIKLSVTTQQLKTLGYLSKNDITMKTKELELKTNSENDTKLDEANQTSTFDGVFLQVMRGILESYGSDLRKLYDTTSNADAKKIIKEDFEQTQLLSQQLPTNITTTPDTTPVAP